MSGVSAAVLARLDTLSSHARQILLAERTAADQPIRAELFGLHRFEEHGRSLAQAQVVHDEDDATMSELSPSSRDSFFPRVEENLAALRQAYDYVALTSRTGHYVTPAAEWLLDNFHLVDEPRTARGNWLRPLHQVMVRVKGVDPTKKTVCKGFSFGYDPDKDTDDDFVCKLGCAIDDGIAWATSL